MAASATNTSREMGAVFGVAILGSIVNAKLTGDLAARLKAIGIPPNFQSLVEHAIQTGGASSGGAATKAEHNKNAAVAHIATKVVNAAYNAFGSGLHEALLLSAASSWPARWSPRSPFIASPGRPSRSERDAAVHGGPPTSARPGRRASVRVCSAATWAARSHGPTAAASSDELGTLSIPFGEDGDVGEAHGRRRCRRTRLRGPRIALVSDFRLRTGGPSGARARRRRSPSSAGRRCRHDTRDRPAEEEVADGDRQHGEHPNDCDGVAEPRDQHAHGEPAV